MRRGRRPYKLSPEEVADIESYLAAHKWFGAKAAISKKYRISKATLRKVSSGVYFQAAGVRSAD
jgi:homoserine trans-succinylase